jgi:hypothetical protein
MGSVTLRAEHRIRMSESKVPRDGEGEGLQRASTSTWLVLDLHPCTAAGTVATSDTVRILLQSLI